MLLLLAPVTSIGIFLFPLFFFIAYILGVALVGFCLRFFKGLLGLSRRQLRSKTAKRKMQMELTESWRRVQDSLFACCVFIVAEEEGEQRQQLFRKRVRQTDLPKVQCLCGLCRCEISFSSVVTGPAFFVSFFFLAGLLL